MSKPITKEQTREDFLKQIKSIVWYWASSNVHDVTMMERCEGVAFSILVMLDGGSGLPAFDVIVRPHPDDQSFHEAEGEDYYVDGMVINDDCQLHDLFYKKDNHE